MEQDTFQKILFKALIWGFAYYFVRRGLNPEVENQAKYKMDAMYGTLAAFVAGLLTWMADKYIIPFY